MAGKKVANACFLHLGGVRPKSRRWTIVLMPFTESLIAFCGLTLRLTRYKLLWYTNYDYHSKMVMVGKHVSTTNKIQLLNELKEHEAIYKFVTCFRKKYSMVRFISTKYSQSIFKEIYQIFSSDPFWPITYFSWFYYHWTGSSVIYCIIFISVAILMHLTSWIFVHNNLIIEVKKQAHTDVSVVLHYCIMVIRTLMIPFLVTVWIIRGRRRVHHVFSSIVTVDEKLSKFGQCPSKNSTLKKLIVLICFPVAVIGGVTWYDMNTQTMPDFRNFKSIWIFYSYYHELVELYTQCFFGCLALLLGDRYEAVNSILKKISQEYNYALRNNQHATFNWIFTIQELRAVHRKLFFAAEEISEAFGLQLFIIIIISLMAIIGNLYQFYLENILHCGFVASHVSEYIIWCWIHAGPLCIAAFCCSRTSSQEKYTELLLQDMIVSEDNLRMEISMFSLQLIHYDVHFSVCGFYNVDLSLIKIIVRTIAMYLVILIQIGSVPHNCGNSSIANTSVNNYSNIY